MSVEAELAEARAKLEALGRLVRSWEPAGAQADHTQELKDARVKLDAMRRLLQSWEADAAREGTAEHARLLWRRCAADARLVLGIAGEVNER